MTTPEILEQFKERMHLEGDEDANLGRILSASEKELIRLCGEYDIEEDEIFKELVFERSRYAYNDALEYFNANFLTEINNLSMAKALESVYSPIEMDYIDEKFEGIRSVLTSEGQKWE